MDQPIDKWVVFRKTLSHLVLETDQFIIGVDADGDLDWETSKMFDSRTPKSESEKNKILNGINLLEHSHSVFPSVTVRTNFKCLLGEALARVFEDDYPNAEALLANADQYIQRRALEQARTWHLQASGIATAIITVPAFLVFWLNRAFWIPWIGFAAFYVIISMATGALGALLSVITRLGKIKLDPMAEQKSHYYESSYRIVAGMTSAVPASLCVYAGLILPVLTSVNKTMIGMVIAGFAAGLLERYAPSIISQVTDSSTTTPKAPDDP